MQKQIDRIEKELIEQEHRPLKLITNFIDRKRKWPNNKSKQNSAVKAILWRLFFSPAVIAFTGGCVAIVTLFILLSQNRILKDQNTLIEKQNIYFRNQLAIGNITKYENIFMSATESPYRRKRAIISYLKSIRLIEDNKNVLIELTGANLTGCAFQGHQELFKNVDFTDCQVDWLTFHDVDLSGSRFIDIRKPDLFASWGFVSCNLTNVQFENIPIEGAIVIDSDLSGTKNFLNELYNSTTWPPINIHNINLPEKAAISELERIKYWKEKRKHQKYDPTRTADSYYFNFADFVYDTFWNKLFGIYAVKDKKNIEYSLPSIRERINNLKWSDSPSVHFGLMYLDAREKQMELISISRQFADSLNPENHKKAIAKKISNN